MDEIRKKIQEEFDQIADIDCGVPIPDGMVENGKNYFGYELQETYRGSDFDKRYTMQVDISGRLVRKDDPETNTLETLDNALEELKTALKNLNFKYSYNDISFQDGIRKILVRGNARYNESNNSFIV